MAMLEKLKSIWNTISIEPVFFLFSLAVGFYAVVAKTLYVDKVCKVNLNYTDEICDNIQQHVEEQVEVQKYVSSLQAYNSIIQAIPACIYSLLAGPWSDRHGRKLLIICSTFGYVFNNAVFIINAYFFYELKAEYLLFECLQDCTGGHVCFYLACYSYIADVTEPEKRTKRLALLDGVFPLGFYIGNASSGIIKVRLGFMYNFSLGMLFAVAAMAYTYLFVPDSRPIRDARIAKQLKIDLEDMEPEDKERTLHELDKQKIETAKDKKLGFFASLFNIKNFVEAWRTVTKKREDHKRIFIILLILAFELEIFIGVGRWNSLFLFFRKHLKWTVMEYSRYTTILGVLGLLSQYFAVPLLSEKLKLHDSTISLLDAATSFVNCFVIAFAVNEWMLYIGAVFSFLDATSTTLFRSMITKNVSPDEVGKIFSVVGTFQALMPFASSPLFGFLYKATVGYLPQAFLFLVAAFKFVEFVVVFIVNFGMRREEKKRKLRHEQHEREQKEQEKLMREEAEETYDL